MIENIFIPIALLVGIAVVTTAFFTRFRWGSFSLGLGAAYPLFIILWWIIMQGDTESHSHIWSLIVPLLMAAPTSFLLPYVGGPSFADKCVALALLGAVQYGAIGLLIDLGVSRWKRKRETANKNLEPISGSQ